MTPLQKAAQELLELHLPTYLDTQVSHLRTALEAEQAQVVEPVAWMHPSRDPHLVSHSAYTYGSASVPLYTHPAPPAQQGLSLDLLERLSKTLINLGYSTPEGGTEHFGAQIESQLYNLCRGVDSILAQQVAVPQEFSDLTGVAVCCGDFAKCHRPCTPRGQWMATKAYQVAVPPGFALVPIEPAEEMITAGAAVVFRNDDCEADKETYRARGQAIDAYTQMLAAAQPPKGDRL